MKYYIIAGDASGDLHASNLMKEIRLNDDNSEFRCWGGDLMKAQGATLVKHYRELAFMGFLVVAVNLRSILRNISNCKKDIAAYVPDIVILVDYPGFNLRIARFAKNAGFKVCYYISPQVWAWGRYRIRRLARSVDFMAVILPLEEGIYRDEGIPVEFVGHPLAEESALPEPKDQGARSGIGLLPGSRPGEVRRILPVLLASAERIRRERPDETFSIGLSPSVPRRIYKKIVGQHDVDTTLNESAADVMAKSRLLLIASGTADAIGGELGGG
ncbi:MAG: lipid-A-disaccharide synthase, partial [Bacteroidetes bacterium]|nr:lipid-A-disaccharide synthase [Bacteroidota bacterium]